MNRLVKRIPDTNSEFGYVDLWYVPLIRARSGHLFARMDCPTPIYLTKMQLNRLHKQFSHPSATKLFNVIARARPLDATPATRKILEEIGKRYDVCQRIQTAPKRFRVAIGTEDIQFNERVLMDVM